MMNVRDQLLDVAAKLDAMLRVRYAASDDDATRRNLTTRYIVNELRRWQPQLKLTASLDEAIACAITLSQDDVAVVRRRCLFYGCDDLIGLLVRKRIKSDAIAREEAVLYVQDRLQRDDFRRIDTFEQGRGASIVTYMWQVINNLLIDYLRAHTKTTWRELAGTDHESEASMAREWEASAKDETGSPQTQAEVLAEAAQLRIALVDTMNPAVGCVDNPLRSRLREHLCLSSKERILLKAMFQYDMSIAEISELPGFEMSAAETYRLYYRVMDRLMDAFKQAGLTDELRELVSNVAPQVLVAIGGTEQQVAASRIYYLQQDGRRTLCHLLWRDRMHGGAIAESFSKLCKRLVAYFTPIDASTALADNVLAATYGEWRESGEVAIVGVERRFRISVRLLSSLKSRFGRGRAEITKDVARITDSELDEVQS